VKMSAMRKRVRSNDMVEDNDSHLRSRESVVHTPGIMNSLNLFY
jgi:hypothetical protein